MPEDFSAQNPQIDQCAEEIKSALTARISEVVGQNPPNVGAQKGNISARISQLISQTKPVKDESAKLERIKAIKSQVLSEFYLKIKQPLVTQVNTHIYLYRQKLLSAKIPAGAEKPVCGASVLEISFTGLIDEKVSSGFPRKELANLIEVEVENQKDEITIEPTPTPTVDNSNVNVNVNANTNTFSNSNINTNANVAADTDTNVSGNAAYVSGVNSNTNTFIEAAANPNAFNEPDSPYFAPFVLLSILIVAAVVASFLGKKLFDKWKYGKNAAVNLGVLKKTVALKEELAQKWMRKRKNQNLHAIGVGKIDGTDDYCIQIFVKNANGEMPDNPPIHLLPEKFRSCTIEIIEAPQAELLGFDSGDKNASRQCCETITGGISGANTNLANQTGTIGYFCVPTILRPIRKFRQEIYLLSNCHVFVDLNNLNKAKKDTGDLIQQPSPGENNRHDFVASLEKYVPILFDNDVENPNYTDAAIARLFKGKTHRLEIPGIGKINDCVPKEQVEIRQKCRKSGRTTGLTGGEVFSIHLSIWIKYAATGQETFFKEQFLIVPSGSDDSFVEGGDSGSLVADYENKAIGLIFAGAGSNTRFEVENLLHTPEIENLLTADTKKIKNFGVANPINEVLKALNVKLMH